MKKSLAILLVFVLIIGSFAGCNKGGETTTSSDNVSSGEVSSEEVSSEEVSSEEVSSEEGDNTGDNGDNNNWYDNSDYNNEDPSYDTSDDNQQTSSDDYNSDYGDDEEPTAEELRLESVLVGEDKELNEDAIYKEGHLYRLAQAIKKSKSGKEVLMIFYGNSVNTSLDNSEAPYWKLFEEWWSSNIGPCKVVAASMENFTSIDACMRVDHDILSRKPDVVFLDFAVQDAISSKATTNAKGYDNLIRRILQSSNKPAVVSLILTGTDQESYRMNAANAAMFSTASKFQKQVASYYNIPIIDFETALWNAMFELVNITTQMEIPLMTWVTVSEDNVTLNDSGHKILQGTISYFINKVNNKLNKAPTKDYAYPTEGYFGIDTYMKGSLVDVATIANGKATGYSFDLTKKQLAEYGYSLIDSTTDSGESPISPYISTFRHYVPADDASDEEKEKAVAPHYLAINMPEVKSTETAFFTLNSTSIVSASQITNPNVKEYAPITIECYDKDGNKIASLKNSGNYYRETMSYGKTTRLQMPIGTTKVVIKIFTPGGYVRLLGLGYFR